MFSLKQGLKALIDRQLTRLYRRLAEIQAKDAQVATTSLLGTLRSCGAGIVVVNPIKMYGGDKISIGNNVHIGENAFIRGEGGLSIGDNTFISRNLVLYTMSHRYNGDRLPYDDGFLIKPVIVGSNVWIGMNVCIAPGT